MKLLSPAIFLDRDGVIIHNKPLYVRSWKDVRFIAHTKKALAHTSQSKYKIVIVTNQSAVGRKIISLEQANIINYQIVQRIVTNGGRIDGVFMCPHHPNDNCNCRKPSPGLFEQAAKELCLDLNRSTVFGDTWEDLLAGHRAGIRSYRLVLTGRGKEQLTRIKPSEINNVLVFSNLVLALEELLSKDNH